MENKEQVNAEPSPETSSTEIKPRTRTAQRLNIFSILEEMREMRADLNENFRTKEEVKMKKRADNKKFREQKLQNQKEYYEKKLDIMKKLLEK